MTLPAVSRARSPARGVRFLLPVTLWLGACSEAVGPSTTVPLGAITTGAVTVGAAGATGAAGVISVMLRIGNPRIDGSWI